MIGDHHQVSVYMYAGESCHKDQPNLKLTLSLSHTLTTLLTAATSCAEHGLPEVLQHGAEHVCQVCQAQSSNCPTGRPGQSQA